jgi:hypothetical protein
VHLGPRVGSVPAVTECTGSSGRLGRQPSWGLPTDDASVLLERHGRGHARDARKVVAHLIPVASGTSPGCRQMEPRHRNGRSKWLALESSRITQDASRGRRLSR